MLSDNEEPIASRPSAVDTTPFHKISRSLLGLPLELQLLATPVRSVMSSAASQTSQPESRAAPFVLHAPRTPRSFRGDRFEDVQDWLCSFDRVAAFN